MMAGAVLGGYFMFYKNRCGRYRYNEKINNKNIDLIEEIAAELVDPNTDIVENDQIVLIKAVKMPPYTGGY